MLQTVAIVVRASPLPTPDSCTPASRDLMLTGIAWLQQCAKGQRDGLLLIGRGFGSDETFASQLEPFGLAECSRQLVGDDLLRHEDAADDIAALCQRWLRDHHPKAVPVARWPDGIAGLTLPEAWWQGVEPRPSWQLPYEDTVSSLAPGSFKATASTWCALLHSAGVFNTEPMPAEEFAAAMCAAQFARWLHGAVAASGDAFFNFDCSEVFEVAGLDDFRLGYEARDADCDTAQDLFDEGATPNEVRTAAVEHLLRHRSYFNPLDLREELGDTQSLVFSLHGCIWPRWDAPVAEAVEALLGESSDEDPDIQRLWQFAGADDACFSE